ncbi:hypothetical protein B4Q13_21800, partial [Lacticaseibacillus rhamnosus]
EAMWTPAQVRAKHPPSGEVMLAGSMGGGMSMGGSSRHVEVKIMSRSNGKVVTSAHPRITVVAESAKNAMAIQLPYAGMRGVDEGSADIHYGNNVDLVGGHKYRVTVALVALVAVDFPDQPFVITLPKHSDPFGNPQIDPVPRSQVPQFYGDFYNTPGPINHGQTINGYWMEQSRGQVGIGKIDVFGPYRMPKNL